jgi:hypothetical protein
MALLPTAESVLAALLPPLSVAQAAPAAALQRLPAATLQIIPYAYDKHIQKTNKVRKHDNDAAQAMKLQHC